MKKIFLLLWVIGFYPQLFSQSKTVNLSTIEGITDTMLSLLSGPIGEERNWETYRNLFLPTAQKISVRESRDGKVRARVMNIEEFIRYVGPFYAKDGFEEYAIGLTINEFNGIANVFQSYYCKNLKGTYEKRGVNSYQLVYMDNRWWIASTVFTDESDTTKLPNHLLYEKYQSH